MFLANILIILQALSMSLSYETESENLLRREREYFQSIANTQNLSLDKSHQSKAKIPKKISPTSIIKGTSMATNTSAKLTKYVEHIKRQGVKTLNYIGKDILKEMKQDTVKITVNNVSNLYMTKVQDYLDYISGPNMVAIYDKKFILPDICEIACRILFHLQKKMLTQVIVAANLTDLDDTIDYSVSLKDADKANGKSFDKSQIDSIKNISETIFKYNTEFRKKEMKYICKKYKVCRSYPSLTDYCGYFLSEILRLPSNKFYIIAKLLGIVLKTNDDVMSGLVEITNYDKFTKEVDTICNDETKIKESLVILKDVLSQKFGIMRNPALNFGMRASAIRILLDIIDRSFSGQMHDEFVIDFDTTVSAIRMWANNETPSIALDIGKLLDLIFRILNNIIHSDKTDRKSLVILVEMIREGNSEQHVHNYVHKRQI